MRHTQLFSTVLVAVLLIVSAQFIASGAVILMFSTTFRAFVLGCSEALCQSPMPRHLVISVRKRQAVT